MVNNPKVTSLNLVMHKLLLLLGIFGGCSLLVACSGGGGYFQNDGPPAGASSLSFANTPDAVPKYEKPHSGANKPYTINGKRYVPVTGDKAMTQIGTASWYGKKFHGNKTSTGEIYNMYAMTAAHTTMELPSYAKVTNLANGKSVIVRVNDRGPFVNNRIIDLSYAAASKLGYVNNGTAKVKVERIRMADIKAGRVPTSDSRIQLLSPDNKQKAADVAAIATVIGVALKEYGDSEKSSTPSKTQSNSTYVNLPSSPASGYVITDSATNKPQGAVDLTQAAHGNMVSTGQIQGETWSVQAGAFGSLNNANSYAETLRKQISNPVYVFSDGNYYRVLIGEFSTRDNADAEAQVLGNLLGKKLVPYQKQ